MSVARHATLFLFLAASLSLTSPSAAPHESPTPLRPEETIQELYNLDVRSPSKRNDPYWKISQHTGAGIRQMQPGDSVFLNRDLYRCVAEDMDARPEYLRLDIDRRGNMAVYREKVRPAPSVTDIMASGRVPPLEEFSKNAPRNPWEKVTEYHFPRERYVSPDTKTLPLGARPPGVRVVRLPFNRSM